MAQRHRGTYLVWLVNSSQGFFGVCCARGAEERTQNPKKSDDARNKYALPVCVGVGGAMSVGCEVRMSKRQPDGSTHAGRRRLLFC